MISNECIYLWGSSNGCCNISGGFLSTNKPNAPVHYRVSDPHDSDTDNHIDNDIFCLFDFFLISGPGHDLESRIHNIEDSNERDETQKIHDNILGICRKGELGYESSYSISCSVYTATESTTSVITYWWFYLACSEAEPASTVSKNKRAKNEPEKYSETVKYMSESSFLHNFWKRDNKSYCSRFFFILQFFDKKLTGHNFPSLIRIR